MVTKGVENLLGRRSDCFIFREVSKNFTKMNGYRTIYACATILFVFLDIANAVSIQMWFVSKALTFSFVYNFLSFSFFLQGGGKYHVSSALHEEVTKMENVQCDSTNNRYVISQDDRETGETFYWRNLQKGEGGKGYGVANRGAQDVTLSNGYSTYTLNFQNGNDARNFK